MPRIRLRPALLLLLAAAPGCAGTGPADVAAHGPAGPPSLEDEAAELCRLHVDRRESEERAMARRLDAELWRLSSGALSPDTLGGGLGRLHAEAHGRCLDQVLSALEGPGGEAALRILQEARVGCEAAVGAGSRAHAVDCIHRRKLELFRAGGAAEGPAGRETLDRLLRVGGGAPLSDEQRAAYCRTRELAGTGHPLCP